MNVNETVAGLTISAKTEGVDQAKKQVDSLVQSTQQLGVVTEQSSKGVISLETAWKRATLRFDEAARAQANIERETRLANNAVRQGLATQQQADEHLARVAQRYNTASQSTQKFTQQTGLARHELINLGRQAQDVAVSLAGGQGFGTVMLQQGSQIADVFVSSGKSVGSFFSQAIGWGARFVTSAAGVATGIAAIAGGAVYMASSWVSAQKDIEKALSGVGGRSLATATDINTLAEANAKSSRLSVSESREAALEFVKTGNIQKDNIIALTGLVDGFSKTVDKSSKEAAQDLAKIFSGDVIGAAQQLDKIYGTASSNQLQYIRNLENAGQRQQAIAETVRVFERDIKNAADQTGFWAASWNSVSNAASNAADAIGKALSKQTGVGQGTEERLASLQKEFEMLQKNAEIRQDVRVQRGLPAVGPEGAAGAERIRQLLAEIAELEAKAGKGAEDLGKQFGKAGDDAVRSLLPQIEQLEKVDKLIADMNKAQKEGTGRGLSAEEYEKALRAAEVLKDRIKQIADETDRANANGLKLKEQYQTSTIEAARTLDALKDQANVAAAVGGAARMAAQEQARYNQLIREGKDAMDATRIAAAERKVTQEGINAGAKEMLLNLQDQAAVARAVGGAARIAAEAQATYNSLVRQGVDAQTAGAVAGQQAANAQAQINAKAQEALEKMQNQRGVSEALTGDERIRAQAMATYKNLLLDGVSAQIAMKTAVEQEYQARAQVSGQLKEQAFQLNQQAELTEARLAGTQAGLKAEQAYTNAIRAGASQSAASEMSAAVQRNEDAEEAERLANDRAQANSNAAAQVEREVQAMAALVAESNRLRAALSFVPTITLALGGGTQDLFQSRQGGYSQFKTEGYTSTLSRLGTGVGTSGGYTLTSGGLAMPDMMKDAFAPILKKLDENTKATEDNTDVMTDVLSPYYSQDPRRTHLGFRAFAGGGIMTPYGELPLRQYAGGGIANQPQVAMFGEGSTPEAYVPVPNGMIPVEIKTPANSNARPIVVNINIAGNADANTVAALKGTAFQQTQTMRRVMGS